MLKFYQKVATTIFDPLSKRLEPSFETLKPHLKGAGMTISLRAWISSCLLTTLLTYTLTFIFIEIANIYLLLEPFTFLYILVFVPILSAAFSFVLLYIYPIELAKSKQKSIDTNLPFALAHMSAIASSGIPPEFMFEMLTEFKEYGEIAKQSKMIVNNMKVFGMSSVAAMKDVAEKSPSKLFRHVILGIASTIEKGGNLVEYLKVMSDKALFEYRIRREAYLKTLSTYADLYTGLLVAAPLIILATLAVMAIVGGEILGMTIGDVINLITWTGLPFLNIMFLIFVHITYPGV
ncbi:MAG: type II secretion system F family protein [Candidatus Aenigmatarchaeota archaeon]